MDDMSNETKSTWRRLGKAIGETFFEVWGVFRPGWDFLKSEAEGVRNGWFLFVVLLVIGSSAVGFGVWWKSYSRLTEAYGSDLLSRQEEHAKAKNERDKYFVALQPWQALASSIYTNVPPSDRLMMLADQVSAMTNTMIQLLKSSELEFEIYVNGRKLTNAISVIYLGSDPKEIKLAVRNSGQVAARNLSMVFYAELDKTNFVVDAGWTFSNAMRVTDGTLGTDDKFTVLRGVAEFPIGSLGVLTPSAINLTNVGKLLFNGKIEVFAEGSQSQKALVKFVRIDDVAPEF